MSAVMHFGEHDGVEDTLLCDVPVVEWGYVDDNVIVTPSDPRPCGAEVYLTWSFAMPVRRGEVVEPKDVPKAAITHSWRLECTEGHVLAVSNVGGADDYAEPFDPAVVIQ